ncbi:hypothetical protein INR49_019257 [Caranx melampygus]|nr:hypothetical protein INR49_019257 [Caranx melampygus]
MVVVLLLGCHLYLVSINSTTWEFMSRHRISYLKNCGNEENPFDRGVFCNLWDFFCICRTVVWEQVYQRRTSNPDFLVHKFTTVPCTATDDSWSGGD